MLLRTKLLLSFLGVLALTVAVAFSGWHGLSEVTRLMRVSKNIEDGNSMIADARYGQASYLLSATSTISEEVRTNLQAAQTFFKAALKDINIPARATETEKILSGVDVTIANFETLTQHTKAMTDADANLIATGGSTVKTLATLVGNFEKDLARNLNEQTAQSYTTLIEASNNLYMARLRALGFNMRPTAENASGALGMVDKALDALTRTDALLQDRASKDLLSTLVQDMVNYRKSVEQLTSATLKRVAMIASIREQIRPLVDIANNLTLGIGLNANEVRNSANTQLWVSLALAVFLGLVLAGWLTSNVLNQLGRDPGVLTRLAERVTNGDFDIDDGGPSRGVYANLVGMVSNLKSNIEAAHKESQRAQVESAKAQEAMKTAEEAKRAAESARRDGMFAAAESLDSVVGIVSSASTELSAQLEQSERGSVEQASRVSETATAMEEMNSTVLEVARNAGTASEVTKSARAKAEEGANIVAATVQGIQKVQRDSLDLKEDMVTLAKHAQDISQIMGVISDIADQTNLLALNAAIEAARAGEAGRGFAVVADEVRKLAEKTMTSTTNVGNAIKSIQQSADKSMEQVDATVRNIEIVTSQAENSGTALREIVSLVDAAADQVNAIATASEQQSATSDEINRSITQVSKIAGDTARAMQESAVAVSELANQSLVLTRLMEDLKKA